MSTNNSIPNKSTGGRFRYDKDGKFVSHEPTTQPAPPAAPAAPTATTESAKAPAQPAATAKRGK